MYGIRYLRVFDYVSVSWCATGPVRESEGYPERPQMEKITSAPITAYPHWPFYFFGLMEGRVTSRSSQRQI